MDDVRTHLSNHHDHLAAWLSDGDVADLDAFIGVHHPDFTLVTTAGEILELDALRAGLGRAGGTQPGMRIVVDDVTAITSDVHRFIERHLIDGAEVDVRVVTAVLAGNLVIGLQETARPAQGQEA